MAYIKNLKVGDVVKCLKNVYSEYDVGASGMCVSGIAFENGKHYAVVDVAYVTSGCAYVKDPDDGCLHGINDDKFIKV